ncbi:MAG TPA: TraB/GumN family protein [Oligoflexia bacterium]|nr:TraB/GumN family protein [Oligoflexia bacterium]HMP47718.1 TraB/GumN family protein [Oligoflexia bacterium]
MHIPSDIEGPLEILTISGRKLYLLGTAHVSKKSADEVRSLICSIKPDVVCIELCHSRMESFSNPDRWKNTDIFDVIKSGRTFLLLAQVVLASFQKRIANKLGIEPGAEMRAAIEAAKEVGSRVEVIDRDVKITLRRTWKKLSIWSILKLIASSFVSVDPSKEVSLEEIEALKGKDELSAALHEFSEKLPEVKETLVDERDSYMSSKLQKVQGEVIVAVLGAGHLPGMTRHLTANAVLDHEQLEVVPPTGLFFKILGYSIPIGFVGVILYASLTIDLATGLSMMGAWAALTGACAAIGAGLALAHPVSIIAAALAAPVASLHPGIATGWVSGLVEAWLRKPKVQDFESIAEDLESFRGFWKNRVMRIILVVSFSNLGCLIGMWLGSLEVIQKF